MSTYRYPLASTTWDEAEYSAMERVVKSGMFTMGGEVRDFENSFAEYVGARYSVMVNSGSSANLLMVGALAFMKENSISRGDEVIVPAVSWSTTYFPLYQYGLKLKFVDIDLETLNYDLDKLEAAVSPATKLIMVVNLLGNPNDFSKIKAIADANSALVIEDNCESMGATYDAKHAGTFGVMGSFSSFFSHHISTMEGGLIVTDDEELYHILLSLRAHGWTRNLPKINKVTGTKSDDPFEESFRFVLPGYNVRPLELSGALGSEQVKKLPMLIENRRKNARHFQEVMAGHQTIMIQKEVGESSWFGFSLIIRPGSTRTRKELLSCLGEAGFEARPIVTGNFAKNEVLKYMETEIPESLASADHLDANGLFIGNHHHDMEPAMHALRAAVANF